jgi:hypothetical protein
MAKKLKRLLRRRRIDRKDTTGSKYMGKRFGLLSAGEVAFTVAGPIG